MDKQIMLPVLVTGLQSKVDGSIKITLETRELPPEQAVNLFEVRNQEAWCVIAPEKISEVNLPNEKPDAALGTKTPSQRLRNVLYVYWQQHRQGDFETFYRVKIEQIIEQLKDKLE